jgi:hypothetical protein
LSAFLLSILFLISGAEGLFGAHRCPIHDAVPGAAHATHDPVSHAPADHVLVVADHNDHGAHAAHAAVQAQYEGPSTPASLAQAHDPSASCPVSNESGAAPCSDHSHGTACTCLGTCQAGAAPAIPAAGEEASPELAATRLEIPRSAADSAVRPLPPYFLPYALAPPAHG